MPFGLVNAGATYERMMRKLFSGMQEVANYVDHVIVYSSTWDEHTYSLRELFSRVKKASLTVNLSKCRVACTRVDVISE